MALFHPARVRLGIMGDYFLNTDDCRTKRAVQAHAANPTFALCAVFGEIKKNNMAVALVPMRFWSKNRLWYRPT